MNKNIILIIFSLNLSYAIYGSSDGDLDTSFNPNSAFSDTIPGTIATQVPPFSSLITSMALQKDGKIIICGMSETTNESIPITRVIVARYFPDGSLDTSFIPNNVIPGILEIIQAGIIAITIDNSSIATHIINQPDNKILIIGNKKNSSVINSSIFALRLLPNGDLDTTFNPENPIPGTITSYVPGIIIITINGIVDFATTAILQKQPDNSQAIVIAGATTLSILPVFAQLAVFRLTINGDLDTTFNSSGSKPGFFLLGGSSGTALAARCIKLDSNNNIIMSGEFATKFIPSTPIVIFSDFAIVKLTPNGTAFPGFGTNGLVTTAIGPVNDVALGVEIDANNNIIAAGYTTVHGTVTTEDVSSIALAKYLPGGSLDSTFGTNGIVKTPVPVLVSPPLDSIFASSIGIQNWDGKIVVTGAVLIPVPLQRLPPAIPGFQIIFPTNSMFMVARYNTNGSLDSTFNPTGQISGQPGIVLTAFSSDISFALAINQACKRIVAAGMSTASNNIRELGIARYFLQGCVSPIDSLTLAIRSKYNCANI